MDFLIAIYVLVNFRLCLFGSCFESQDGPGCQHVKFSQELDVLKATTIEMMWDRDLEADDTNSYNQSITIGQSYFCEHFQHLSHGMPSNINNFMAWDEAEVQKGRLFGPGRLGQARGRGAHRRGARHGGSEDRDEQGQGPPLGKTHGFHRKNMNKSNCPRVIVIVFEY